MTARLIPSLALALHFHRLACPICLGYAALRPWWRRWWRRLVG